MPDRERPQRPSVEERRRLGREARKRVPRGSHEGWRPDARRADPLVLLAAQDMSRIADLVPVRYGRMAVSPFTFYRGSSAVMAADLAGTPVSGIDVQLCGDAHLSNFGLYASPERTLLFDVNDFDETLPGPFEWDVKRLAASVTIAGRGNGFAADATRDATLAAVRSYREHMLAYAELRDLEVWYSKVAADDLLALVEKTTGVSAAKTAKGLAKARGRDNLQAFAKLTEVVDGVHRIREDPPLLIRVVDQIDNQVARHAFAHYIHTLEDDRRVLMERYTPVDIGRKVVGVGSVGTMCLVVLLEGRDDDDPLLLQVKEAGHSVLEAYLGPSRYTNHGHRVVAGQRLMQAYSDIFLGWMRGAGAEHRHFYWRQLRDMKGSAAIERMKPQRLLLYAEACGWALARAHARSGDRIAIAAYLGLGDRFDRAVADFAAVYADQAERDHERLARAIAKGEIAAQAGL